MYEERGMTKKNGSRIIQVFVAVLMLFQCSLKNGFAVEARDYVPCPSGTAALLMLYLQSAGHEMYQNGDRVSEDVNLKSDIQVFEPVYYSSFMGMPTIFQGIIPVGSVTLDGAGVGNNALSSSGLADPAFLVGIWPIHDPAGKTWLGVSEWVTFPFGEYDSDRGLNLGSNQWAFKTQAGLAKGFGDLIVEIIPSVEFYTDNSDYGVSRQTLEKDPLFALESHLSYDVTKTVQASLDYFYSNGGETKVAGATVNEAVDTHSLQLTIRLGMAQNQLLHLQFLKDLSVENGIMTHRFGAKYTYVF
jgi:hypothetical protein